MPAFASDRLVLPAQPGGENAQDLERKKWRVPDQEQKLRFLHRRDRHVAQGHDSRAARTVVDQRHFAENPIRADRLITAVAAPDLHLSAHDDEELVALIALLEDRLALGEIPRRDSRPEEMMETAFAIRHFASLRVAPTRLSPQARHDDKPIAQS